MAAAAMQAETEVGHKSSPKRTTAVAIAVPPSLTSHYPSRWGSHYPHCRQLATEKNVDVFSKQSELSLTRSEAVRVGEHSDEPAQEKALLARGPQECPTSGIWSMAIWLETQSQRKARSMDVLRKYEADPLVILGRPEDREGTRVVRARCECGPGLG
jgi:hypothetical protein